MNIAFCIDSISLRGFGATLSSLIGNCSNTKNLNIYILLYSNHINEQKIIEKLFLRSNFKGNYKFIAFNPYDFFSEWPSLHGSYMAYGRLLLVDFIPQDTVLYLDTDLIVEIDVLELENYPLGEFILGAVGETKFRDNLGGDLYEREIGISPYTTYFNSGVLYLNLKEWRNKKIKELCLSIAQQYKQWLPSHDQSILNIICQGKFLLLPPSFNCLWEAHCPKPQKASKMVLHFAGSPKPWDIGGRFFHRGYDEWKRASNSIWLDFFKHFSWKDLGRAWKIRRSYIRVLLLLFKNEV